MMMTRRIGLGVVLCTLLVSEGASGFQQATIRYDPQAPLSPLPQEFGEFEGYEEVQNQPSAARRLALANNFLSAYPNSEFRHLILRARWEVRVEQGDSEEIIEAAEDGLEAQEHFRTGKLGFISDPSRVRGLPEFRFTFASQRAAYYQSMVEAYRDEEDFDQMVEFGELGVIAAAEAWNLFEGIEDEGTLEYQAARDQNDGLRLFILHNILDYYQNDNDVPKVVEYGERILEISPDDIETLMSTSLVMVEQPPQDISDLTAHLQRAQSYAENAVQQLGVLFSGPTAVDFDDQQRAAFTADAQYTLGLASFQLEEWENVVEALNAAIDAVSDDPQFYFMLGLASRQLGDVEGFLSAYAKAVYLEHPQPAVRIDLETIYGALNGSVDNLDEYIESEGSQIGN